MTRIACYIGNLWGMYLDIYYATKWKELLPKIGISFTKNNSFGIYFLWFFIGIRFAEWGTGFAFGLTFAILEIGVTYEQAKD